MEMAECDPPYIEYSQLRAVFIIATRGAPDLKDQSAWSPAFKQFLRQCLDMDVTWRVSCDEVLSHPFLLKACSADKFIDFVTV